jgi:hypothetical protein
MNEILKHNQEKTNSTDAIQDYFNIKMNNIYRKHYKFTNKLKRSDIKKHLMEHHLDKIQNLHFIQEELDTQLLEIQIVTNNYLKVNRNISEEKIKKIKDMKTNNQVLNLFKPLILSYFLSISTNTEEETQHDFNQYNTDPNIVITNSIVNELD